MERFGRVLFQIPQVQDAGERLKPRTPKTRRLIHRRS
jgi:hypothetical protein